MRDLLLVAVVLLVAIVALRRPWIGVMLWTWISIMNPHRYTWGFAYDAPLAMIAAISTLIGLVVTRDRRENPLKGAPAVLLLLFMGWITVSWLMGLDPGSDQRMWDKVMKIYLMLLVSLVLLHSKQHVFAMMWVCVGSLAFLGAKGGVFTIATAGNYRVWGPEGSFIADNNQFALALVMTIPLLRFLQLQLSNRTGRLAMTALMVLVAAAALGSYSRGALVAITAMTLMLWWKGRNRVIGAIVLSLVAVALLAFMPDQWGDRMSTIQDYGQDASALGRISAWWVAWRIGLDYPFGVGFNAARPELFLAYSPYPEIGVFAAHSIYFQILGHHGLVGLGIWLLMWLTTWLTLLGIRREAGKIPEARWCVDLANMVQVSLIGYAVGGAFLSLAYFDLPYNLMVVALVTRAWIRRRAWASEAAPGRFSWVLPGLGGPLPAR